MGEGSEYQFFAWSRSGVGALLDGAARSVTLDLGVHGQVPTQLTAFGLGDVQGIDPRAIARTVPRDGAHDFEPNMLASVELAHPGMPWWLSGPPDPAGHVTPWIALVVVEVGPGVTVRDGQLEIVTPASTKLELPPFTQLSAWAHTQVTSTQGGPLDTASLGTSGGAARARLVAPRKLAPTRSYIACVIPTTPGWTGTEVEWRTPVYFSWRFSTGEGGDFASLARRLKPVPLDAAVGHRQVDISTPGWGAPSAAATLDVPFALRAPKAVVDVPPAHAGAIGDVIMTELERAVKPPEGQVPTFAPPFYGAAATRAESVAVAPAWQLALNQDIRQRIAAGLGADVIRADVDTYVDAAWRQAGDAEPINHAIRFGELAAAVTLRLAEKHLASQAADADVLAIARPLLARMRAATSGPTLAAAIEASAMPSAALSSSFHRLVRGAGRLTQNVSTTAGNLLARIDAGAITGEPPKRLAASAAGFDSIAIAANVATRLELATPALVTTAAAHWKSVTPLPPPHPTHPTPPVHPPTHPTPATHPTPTRMPMPTTVAHLTPIPIGERTHLPPLASELQLVEAEIDDLAAAVRRHQQYIATHLTPKGDTRLPLGSVHSFGEIRAAIQAQFTPQRGVLAILQSRIQGIAVADFTPVAAAPVLEHPLVRALATRAPALVMPGLETMPPNSAATAISDPDFVRAFLVGANEQLARELLWREFPGALGHTWLRTFWGRVALGPDGSVRRVADIDAISEWPAQGPAPLPATLVLAIRGDVIHRYPNAVIYALAANWQGTNRVIGDEAPVAPVFATSLGSDLALIGFDLSEVRARGGDTPSGPAGYYFVIAEHPHEPRFGFATSAISGATSWRDVAWSDLADTDLDGNHLRIDGPLAQRNLAAEPALQWGRDAAHVAAIALRPPFRVAIHASTLMR